MSEKPRVKYLDRNTPPHITTLVLLAGLSALSMNVFLPSLPSMATYFDADYGLVQLSVSLYLLLTGVLQLAIGPLSDRYGRRPVILAGFVIFNLATVGCLLAQSIEIFLVFRMIQAGIATGMVLSRAVVRDMVPANQAASMIAYVTMGMSLVPMLAPTLGGYLDALFGWQANFAIMLILGILVGLIVWLDLGETHRDKSQSLMAQLHDYPELFASRRFWGYVLAAAFTSGSFFAFLGGAPLVGTDTFKLEPSTLGVYFGFVSFGYLCGNYFSGRFSVRFGINRMMLYGSIISLAGLCLSFVVLLAGATHPLAFFGFTIAVGLGNGMVLPNSNAGMLSVRPHLAGTASGLGGAIMLAGGASLAAITGVVLRPEWGAYPLLLLMIATSILATVAVYFVIRVENSAGPLDISEHH
ncbi:MAG: multidrug effflux MFS transporter [Rhodobacteraceae bacterium]|nr:multidrug effflux MFS transporter [Paracoccaceae bacterium]